MAALCRHAVTDGRWPVLVLRMSVRQIPAREFTLFYPGVGRIIEFFGQGKNWRGFCNFVPEFLIDAWAGMAKLPVRF
jgi:hypothetical protein